MRRNSKAYRFQLIKETAEKQQRSHSADPMVRHIQHLLSDHSDDVNENTVSHRFSGHHYDPSIDGWVSDDWS